MCAIAGIFAYRNRSGTIDRGELLRIRDHMTERGPDGAGVWYSSNGEVGLAHRRLAIIDLSPSGAQPMASRCGRFVITFNGEIYNYRELRAELEAKGYRFQSKSDTEVLLALYAEKREAMLTELRGMFAFGIWDLERAELFLCRDPFGIKPLYYSDDGAIVRFASQVKALLAGEVSPQVDPAGLVGFYLWGSVPEPFTVARAVKSLPAGSFVKFDARGTQGPLIYQSVAQIYCEAEAGISRKAPDIEEVKAALVDSARSHLVSDVPVGAFLSAGVDSGALVGLLRDAGATDISTVTLCFDEFRNTVHDEAPLAAEVARHYGTNHHTRVVTEAEFKQDAPKIFAAMDQPSIDGINSWFVSKAASELGLKVAVSGLGGDELFGGYPSFRRIPQIMRAARFATGIGSFAIALKSLNPKLSPLAKAKLAGLAEFGSSFEGAYFLCRGLFLPSELTGVLREDEVREGLERLRFLEVAQAALNPLPELPFAKISALEFALYTRNQLLRDTDWAGMSHSIEIRVPLVDVFLLRRLAPHLLAERERLGKAILACAPSLPLPETVRSRAKTGFRTPIETWLAGLTGRPRQSSKNSRAARQPWARQWAREVACLAV